jgi:CheY-like chemotaxis protein
MKYFDVFCAHAQNGSEATRLLRAGGFKNLVIGVTGNVMEEDVRQYLAAGADMVVAKPMRMATLSSILRHAQVGALPDALCRPSAASLPL